MGGRTVRIHEVAHSGHVIIAPSGATVALFGNPEVFLTIAHANGASEYLSAPTRYDFDVQAVESLAITVLAVVGNDACTSTEYHFLANAHCIYDIL
jgi:hypothetical protein